MWKLAGQEPLTILEKPATVHDFSPDSRQLALGQADNSIHLYDLSSRRQLKQLKTGLALHGLAFHPNNQQLAISHASGVRIHDLETGNAPPDLPPPAGGLHLVWHPDGKMLAVDGNDQTIYLWDVTTRKLIARLKGHRSGGITFAFNHTGELLASACWDGVLRLWDTRTGQQLFSTPIAMSTLRFSADDRLPVRGIDGNKLQLWQFAPALGYRTMVRDPTLGRGEYLICATSTKDPLLAVGLSDGFGLWDLTTGAPLAFLPLGSGYRFVLFEPSGALLTSGQAALRWPIQRDLAAPGLLRIGPPQKLPLPGPTDHLAMSEDGQVLAAAGRPEQSPGYPDGFGTKI